MNSGAVVKALKTRFALVTANGQGEMQGKIFRVAHLGFFDYLDTVALLGAMEHIAKDTLGLPVVYGQAVAAAQEVYADAYGEAVRFVLSQVSKLRGTWGTQVSWARSMKCRSIAALRMKALVPGTSIREWKHA